jgi:hypothetical protein
MGMSSVRTDHSWPASSVALSGIVKYTVTKLFGGRALLSIAKKSRRNKASTPGYARRLGKLSVRAAPVVLVVPTKVARALIEGLRRWPPR